MIKASNMLLNTQSSTNNHSQFVTLIVHRCSQHNMRDAARRAGSAARADTCNDEDVHDATDEQRRCLLILVCSLMVRVTYTMKVCTSVV